MPFVQGTRFSSAAGVPRLIGIYLFYLSRIPFALGLSIQVVSVTKYNAIVSGLPAAMNVFFSSGDSTDGTINFTLIVTGLQGSADGLGPWKLTDDVPLKTKQTPINIPDVPARWDYIVRGVTSGGVTVDSYIFTMWDEASAPLVSSTTSSSTSSSTPTTSSPKSTPTTTLVSSTATESPGLTLTSTSSQSQVTTVASSSGSITSSPSSTSGATTLVFTSGGSVTTIVSPGNTTIATAAPGSGTTTRHSNLGGILGGVLGGLLVFLLLLLLVFFLRRRRRGGIEDRDTASSMAHEDPHPFPGYRVENSVPEKRQLQQMLAERDVLQEHHDALQANSSHSDSGASQSQSGTSDTEMLLRRQILALNERILQLEATQNNSSYLLASDLLSQQLIPPPNYADATVDRTAR